MKGATKTCPMCERPIFSSESRVMGRGEHRGFTVHRKCRDGEQANVPHPLILVNGGKKDKPKPPGNKRPGTTRR